MYNDARLKDCPLMATIPQPRFIDCNTPPDLLAGWPVATCVRASETAQALLLDLDDTWRMHADDLDGKGYSIDGDDRVITVDTGGLAFSAIQRSAYFQNILTLRTLAALRAAWQAERTHDALTAHRIDLWPLLNRVLAADIATMTLRMAFELRAECHDQIWRHAMGDEHGDMAIEYQRTLEGAPCHHDDAAALGAAFMQWFEKEARISKCDFETLADMDADLNANELNFKGRGQIGEGALKCLTIDPVSDASYLGAIAAEIAGNPAWRGLEDPLAEAHFSQIMDEVGSTRIGNIQMRDRKLAERLFPDLLVQA